MRCGICGKEFQVYDLAAHKRQDHPGAYKAQLEAMKQGRRAKAQAREDLYQRQIAAAEAVSKPVLQRLYGGTRTGVTSSDRAYPRDATSGRIRFPEPAAFARYQLLTAQAQAALQEAWDKGEPVPESHMAEIAAARGSITGR